MDNQETLFTSAALLDLLSQIDELADKDINLIEGEDNLKIQIGDSTYDINFNVSEEVEVPEEVDQVADINLIEGEDNLKIQIGDSTYDINFNVSEEVEVPEEVVDQVADINDEAFDELDFADGEVVEGGIIKEALKTLAIGGLVRLTGKLVGKDIADALK